MLSKKIKFSLMSLITMFAFAFIISSAMAQDEFEVKIEGRTSVSYYLNAAGDATDANVVVDVTVTAAQLIPPLQYSPEPWYADWCSQP